MRQRAITLFHDDFWTTRLATGNHAIFEECDVELFERGEGMVVLVTS